MSGTACQQALKPCSPAALRTLELPMHWLSVILACLVLAVQADISVAQTQPIPDNPLQAQTSLGFNPKTRCPDLRIADEGTIAVVVFWVARSGIPSRISIRSSSGSDTLDSAAVSCVAKLRFAPATRLGDGEPLDAWQQIAWRWAQQNNAAEARTMTSQTSPAAAGRASGPTAATPTQTAAEATRDDSGGKANSVTVRVCVDATGQLKQQPTIVNSSGKASLDQAAVKIAASGSAYYRPDTSSNGPPVSGCAQLAIKFETK
jgi:TonB family protein